MINIFRTYQRPLLIALTIVAIIAFVWLYNPADLERLQNTNAGKIYGRTVKIFEVQQNQRRMETAYFLGLFSMIQDLSYGGDPRNESSQAVQFTWNSIVVNTEAARLGIVPTDQEAVEAIKKMPRFQKEGGYDASLFEQFKANVLSPRGVTEDQMFEIVKTDLALKRLKEIIESSSASSAEELKVQFVRLNQKVKLQAVVFNADDFKKEVKVTDEDLQKAYEAQKATLQEPAKREVEYASFLLTEDQKKLPDKERVAALKALFQKASEFTQKMLEPNADFAKLAAETGAKVEQAGEIKEGETGEKLAGVAKAAEAIGGLTAEDPNSDVLQAQKEGFYVLHLKKLTPARQLPFEEVKEKLQEELATSKAKELAQAKANEVRDKVEAEIKAGKPFADAAKALELTIVDLPPSSSDEPDMSNPASMAFRSVLPSLPAGALSKAQESPNGYAFAYVQERFPADESKFKEQEAMISNFLNSRKKERLFLEWLRVSRAQAGLESAYS